MISSPTFRTEYEIESLQLDDVVYFSAFTIWIVLYVINLYTFFATPITDTIGSFSQYLAILLVALSEVIAYRRGIRWGRSSAIAAGICAVLVISGLLTNNMPTVAGTFFLFGARNRNLKLIFTIMAAVYVVTLLSCTLASQAGLIPEIIATGGERTRSYLGFRYPLFPATMIFLLACIVIAIRNDRIDYYTLTALLLAVALTYALTESRLSFILAFAGVVGAFIMRILDVRRIPSQRLSATLGASFIGSALIAIVLSLAYGAGFPPMIQLNDFLGNRLSLGYNAMQEFGVTLFGKDVFLVGGGLLPDGTRVGGTYNYVDSIYLQGVIKLGVAWLVVYTAGMGLATYTAFRSGDIFLGLIFVLVAIHGIIDDQMMNPWMNPCMFYAISLLGEPKRQPSKRPRHVRT